MRNLSDPCARRFEAQATYHHPPANVRHNLFLTAARSLCHAGWRCLFPMATADAQLSEKTSRVILGGAALGMVAHRTGAIELHARHDKLFTKDISRDNRCSKSGGPGPSWRLAGRSVAQTDRCGRRE